MATRAAYFSPSEAQILMEAYEEVKDIIKKKGNTATVIKQREKAWQSIADRLNALNMNGPKRTWQQVKIKYKNILQNAVKKNTHRQGTGGGSPKADLTPAEDMALELNKGRPVLEGIPGGKETSIGSSQDATRFIQVSGSTVFLLEPPAQAPDDADPGEGPSAAATAHDGDDDEEETISLDSRRHEDPDAIQWENQPGNISSQAIRKLYGNHLRRQIELADIDIQYKKKKMENLALESEIKKRTIRKLDLEIKKLERELQEDDTADDHLYERYRFSADGIRYLCRLLGPRIKHRTARSHALSVEQMVCVALRFFASGAFLYSVGDAEQLNKATICRTIRSVCLAIKALADVFISFPGHRRLCDIKEEFYRIAGFPNVIGAVDCTHIRIKAPSGAHEADFVNRKSFHSINVQMVCNADCVISNVVAKWPGSVHDSRIFRASEIYQCLSQGEFSGVLLGDRGYGCQPFLLTPFTDPQEAQQAYNHAHARTRARVEMTFGLLKARFHCLHKLRVSPVRACDITVACAVLHNVACLRKERAPRVPPAMDWDNPAIFPDDDSGRLLRDQYVLNYFS
ncbi:putative nuclease HARBI1 isoform X1 [Osmerus mordax]|uniref:putative nuclease HARBI1 isoform X1 n=1 Tax=Osmerus mordax TaxID=8014 RepID=UPI00350FA23E